MKKIIVIFFICVLVLSGCTNEEKNIDSTNVTFVKEGENWLIKTPNSNEDYKDLSNQLKELNIELTPETKVAALSASTANILYELGMNVVATVDSNNLDDGLKSDIDAGLVSNLGVSNEPNLETLLRSEAEVVFISSEMHMSKQVSNLKNLVILPQNNYEDIFYVVQNIIENFNLPNEANEVLNELIDTHNEALEIQANSDKVIKEVAVFKYTYEEFSIANEESYIGNFVNELNINNIYGDYSDVDLNISKEKVLQDDPEYIIIYEKSGNDYQELQNYLSTQNLENLTAYKNNNIYIVNAISLSSSLESPSLLLDLSEQLYG